MPEIFTQEEFKINKSHIHTRGTTKEKVMERYPKHTNLIEAILYDITPVHYISMVSEQLKWAVKEKECFNVETVKVKYIYINIHELHQKIQ